MFKSKKLVYLLIPLNFFIWGFFIYRFYSLYNEDHEDRTVKENKQPLQKFEQDTARYELGLNYKDPFLKGSVRQQGENRPTRVFNAEKAARPSVVPQVKPVIVVPEVRYLGLIKNSKTGIATALVSINNQSRLVKVNEKTEGLIFKSFSQDSLVVKYGSQRLVVRK